MHYLELAKNFVDHPIYGSGADAVACTDGLVLQMFNHEFDEWQLYAGGIFNGKFFTALCRVKHDGGIGEHRKTDLSCVADNLNAVFFRTFVCHETP